jgi:hypothetical protein
MGRNGFDRLQTRKTQFGLVNEMASPLRTVLGSKKASPVLRDAFDRSMYRKLRSSAYRS